MSTKRNPQHVAVIMDGNGRWASECDKPRVLGHYEGVKTVRSTIEAAREAELDALTLFAFSCENWRRPAEEVEALLQLFSQQLHQNAQELHDNNVRVRVMGEIETLPEALIEDINFIQSMTAGNTGMRLNIALNYSGRWDITRAAQNLARMAADGQLRWQDIDEQTVGRYLALPEEPEPDLLIRTSGEMRISNFMLWQFAYTEFYFTNTLWPNFTKEEFFKAINDYVRRDRRFGTVHQNDVTATTTGTL